MARNKGKDGETKTAGSGRVNRSRADVCRGRSRSVSPIPFKPTPVEARFCHPRTYGSNDVELVVCSKQNECYAESILRRFYDCRISANVLYLADGAPLDAAVHEFGRWGTHYVIAIMPRHEATKAMSVYIFEESDRPTREHRNMNVEDGVDMISRHFRQHYPALARLRTGEIQGSRFYPTASSEVVRTFKQMAESSAVPTSSLEAAISYLQEMRDRTAEFESIPQPEPPMDRIPPPPQQHGSAGNLYRASEMESGLGEPYRGGNDGMRSRVNPEPEDVRFSRYESQDNRMHTGNMDSHYMRQPVAGMDERPGMYQYQSSQTDSSPSTRHPAVFEERMRPYANPQPDFTRLPDNTGSDAHPAGAQATDVNAIRDCLLGLLQATGALNGSQGGGQISTTGMNPGSFSRMTHPVASIPPMAPAPAPSKPEFGGLGNIDPSALQKALASLGVFSPQNEPPSGHSDSPPESNDSIIQEVHPFQARFGATRAPLQGTSQSGGGGGGFSRQPAARQSGGSRAVLSRFGERRGQPGPSTSAGNQPLTEEEKRLKKKRKAETKRLNRAGRKAAETVGSGSPSASIWLKKLVATLGNSPGTASALAGQISTAISGGPVVTDIS